MRWFGGWRLIPSKPVYYAIEAQRPVRPRFLICMVCALLLSLAVVVIFRLNPDTAHSIIVPKASALPASNAASGLRKTADYSGQFNALLSQWALDRPGQQWGISLQSLTGANFTAAYRDQQPFYPASTYKLLLLRALFNKLPYSDWGSSMGSGGLTYAQCIDKMIRYSDNTCGIALGDFTGWGNVQANLESLGLKGTNLDTTDSQLHTTASDLDQYLYSLYQDQDNPQAKKFVMAVMSQQIYRDGIPAGSPGCKVYDKVGFLDSYNHDAAIVECPTVSYILTVMTQGSSFTQIADLARQVNELAVSAALR